MKSVNNSEYNISPQANIVYLNIYLKYGNPGILVKRSKKDLPYKEVLSMAHFRSLRRSAQSGLNGAVVIRGKGDDGLGGTGIGAEGQVAALLQTTLAGAADGGKDDENDDDYDADVALFLGLGGLLGSGLGCLGRLCRLSSGHLRAAEVAELCLIGDLFSAFFAIHDYVPLVIFAFACNASAPQCANDICI